MQHRRVKGRLAHLDNLLRAEDAAADEGVVQVEHEGLSVEVPALLRRQQWLPVAPRERGRVWQPRQEV